MPTAGWNIWGTSAERLRQFTVAKVQESDALAVLKNAHPEIVIVSRHTMDAGTIKKLGMNDGQIVEWAPIDPKQKLTHSGGEPIDKPMPPGRR